MPPVEMYQPAKTMTHTPPHTALQSLMCYLEKEYYLPAERHCESILTIIAAMHGGDDDQTASLYTTLSRRLVTLARYDLRLRSKLFKPFLAPGATGMPESRKLISRLGEGAAEIQALLAQLRSFVKPLHHDTAGPDWDGALHLKIAELDELLTEMFWLEQTALAETLSKNGEKI